ncbi:unnamed protein product [Allacma fusca]|uniref:Uncharacterized protein n=1 Tax=Allacma fusca TaxID=39272 RepID=A0A8J2K914_9HEXA|nr:unnamed protein product [Allacma fusca]
MTLDDCARNVPKRVSKLENFLRKKLSPADLRGLRYYEVCVLQWKGALLIRYIILTEDSIFITENPPKTIFLVIRLSKIQDISVVADRGSLIKGSQGNTPFVCRHVRIFYDDNSNRGSKTKREKLRDDNESGSSESSNDTSSQFGSPLEISRLEDFNAGKTPLFLSRAYDPFDDSSSCNDSDFSDDFISLSKHRTSGESSHFEDKDDCDVKSLESVSTSISIENGEELDLTGRQTGQSPNRASSVQDGRQTGKWSSDGNHLKERPQSIDISQLSTLRKRFIPTYFTRQTTVKSTTPEDPVNLLQSEPEFNVKELNFYLYQQPSSVLNELYLIWNRNKLLYGVQDILALTEETPETNQVHSIHAAEKIMTVLSKEKLLTDAKYVHKFSQLLSLLCVFQQSLVKYHHLRCICWKDANFTTDLVEILQRCVCPDEEFEEYEDNFLERVTVFSVLMDIFRLLFESCSTSFFVQSADKSLSSVHLNHIVTTTNLLHLLFSYPIVSSRMPGRIKILRVIFDPQTYAKLDWVNFQESKVIKALTVAHNSSTALLYEILSLVYFSPRDNGKITLTSLFTKYSLEPYLKQSVTQIINLLWPSRSPLRAHQCSLLYRHVYVVKTLGDNLPSVKTFLQISFCEEFRYFIHWNCISMKVSDRYPIKSKLVFLFDELRKDIMESEV